MSVQINPFTGLKKAEVYGSGTYLQPDGTYVLEVDSMLFKEINAGGQALIVEFNVIESSNPLDPVGSRRTWFQMKNKSFDSAVLEFAFAALDFDYKVATPECLETAKGEAMEAMMKGLTDGALNKVRVVCKTGKKLTKAAKERGETEAKFTTHSWSPVPTN